MLPGPTDSTRLIEAGVPRAPTIVRARGLRRQRWAAAGAAALLVLPAAGAVTACSASPGNGASPPLAGDIGHGLVLRTPAQLLMSLPNPVSFSFASRAAHVVTVQVSLSAPAYSVYQGPVLLRQAGSRWVAMRLARAPGGGWRASYALSLQAGQNHQALQLIPATPTMAPPNGAGQIAISLAARGRVIATQTSVPTQLADFKTSWQTSSGRGWQPLGANTVYLPPGGNQVIRYAISYPVAAGHRLGLFLHAVFCVGVTAYSGCRGLSAVGIRVQWLSADHVWHPLVLAGNQTPGNGRLISTFSLSRAGTLAVQVRVLVAADAVPETCDLEMAAVPPLSGLPAPALNYPNAYSYADAFISVG